MKWEAEMEVKWQESHEVRGSLVKGDVHYYISFIVWTTYIRYSYITHDMQTAYLIITVSFHYYTSLLY